MIVLITEKNGKLKATCLCEDSKLGDFYSEINEADWYAIKHASIDTECYRKHMELQNKMSQFKDDVLRDMSLNFTEEQKKLMWDMLDSADNLLKIL